MSDRKYRPVYMFIFTGLILMVIMMNYLISTGLQTFTL